MKFNIGDLYFSASTTAFILGIIALVAVATICLIAFFRAVRKWRTGSLELLRFLCAVLIVLILWAPEIRQIKEPQDEPMIAILYDASYSMTTLDAKVASIFEYPEDTQIITRQKWVEQALDDRFWKDLEQDGTKIVKIPFSEDNGKKINRSGSDYYKIIKETLGSNDNLKAIIVLGDGDYNLGGEPLTIAQEAKTNKVPIYTVGVGKDSYLPDLEIVSLSAPKFGIVGEAIQIPFTIRSSINRDLKTTVTLKEKNSNKQEVKTITIPANKQNYNNSILFRLDTERSYNFELTVAIQNIEVLKTNNSQSFSLDAKKENIKVLVVDTKPRWEYRFIRNALSRDPGVDLDCLLLHPGLGAGDGTDYISSFPNDLAELQKYDVIFLGDVGVGSEQLTVEQANLIKGLVENQASGLVFIPGSQGNIFSLLEPDPNDPNKTITELADLLPVELDPKNKKGLSSKIPSPLSLTESGKGSLLTMLGDSADENVGIWRNLPGFYWHAPVLKAKLGSEVLAVHPKKRGVNNQRLPLLVTKTYGSGKVLFLGHDSAWKWRRGVEDLYHYRFWGQVARWMSYKRNRAAGENLRLHFSKDQPKAGDIVIVKANAFDSNGAPLGAEHSVKVSVSSPSGSVLELELEREDGDWGAYLGQISITETGTYKVSANTSLQPDKIVEATIDTLSIEIENIGQPSNFDMLRELSVVSDGRFLTGDDIPTLTQLINDAPKQLPEPVRTDLRSASIKDTSIPLWLLGGAVILFALFWTGRKLNGTF